MAKEDPQGGGDQSTQAQGQTPQGAQGPAQSPAQGGPNANVTAPALVIVQEGYSPVKEEKGKD